MRDIDKTDHTPTIITDPTHILYDREHHPIEDRDLIRLTPKARKKLGFTAFPYPCRTKPTTRIL